MRYKCPYGHLYNTSMKHPDIYCAICDKLYEKKECWLEDSTYIWLAPRTRERVKI